MAAARILVQLLDENDTIVHEYRRATTVHSHDSIQKLCRAALGWLQAYGDQATPAQWEMEIRKVTERAASHQEQSVSLRALP